MFNTDQYEEGLKYYQEKEYKKAKLAFQKYLYGSNVVHLKDVYFCLGICCIELNDELKSIEYFEKAIFMDSHFIKPYIEISKNLLFSKQLF